MIKIQLPKFDDNFSVTTTLDNKKYTLKFRYVQKVKRWFFSLYSQNGDSLILDIGICPGSNLIYPNSDLIPNGTLVFISTDRTKDVIKLNDLGTEFKLYYIGVDDV